MSFLGELKRRNVIRTGVLYVVASWIVLQVGDVLFEAMGLPDIALRIVLGILLLGFPLALVFAWVFELTPEGLRREREVDPGESITDLTARKLDIAVIVLLLAAIGIFAFDRLTAPDPQPERTASADPAVAPELPQLGDVSVAVLPFRDMSPDSDQAYFSEGLSDTLIHMLAQVDDLKVAARTSSFAFKDQQKDAREIAQALGVDSLLEGSVQKSGNRLRIIAQLIDASEGTHLWSGTFDRTTQDIFAVQDEIAQEVVRALKGTLLDADSQTLVAQYEPSLEGYQAFLRGRREMAKRNSEALLVAEQHFKRALEMDPDYPLALVNLADVYRLQAEYGERSQPDAIALARPLLDRALALDPDLGEAWVALAGLTDDTGDKPKALEYFEKGLKLAPNYPTAYHWYALRLGELGRTEEALELFLRAAELDPMSDVIRLNLIGFLEAVGRTEQSRVMLAEGLRNNPDYAPYYSITGFALHRADLGRLLWWHAEQLRRDPGNVQDRAFHCFMLSQFPRLDRARACVEELARIGGESDMVDSVEIGLNLMAGRAEEALAQANAIAETTDLRQTRGIGGQRAVALLLKGAYAEAVEQIIALRPELDPANQGGIVNAGNFSQALPLAWAWIRLGEVERGQSLARQVLAVTEGRIRFGPGGIGHDDVSALAIMGRDDEAVQRLGVAIDEGWWLAWRALMVQPWFEQIREREDFRRYIDGLVTRLGEQEAWLAAQPPVHEYIAEHGVDAALQL